MDFSQYIRPELLVIIPMLNLIGVFMKKARPQICKYIPLILGGAGAVLGVAYTLLFPKEGCDMLQNALMGLIQGVLCAGMAVYGHQMSKQMIQQKQQTTQAKEQEPQKQDEKEENVVSTQSGAPEA